MFAKIPTTQYPPNTKPVLIWDGECGFCKYWVLRWEQLTKDRVRFRTYQEIASEFPDIPIKEFKKASRFIDLNGTIFSGPDSAYKSYTYSNKSLPWHRWYHSSTVFRWLSDHGYNFIAKHRPLFYKITILFFGKNPKSIKPYWFIYTLIFLGIFYMLLKLL